MSSGVLKLDLGGVSGELLVDNYRMGATGYILSTG
jgi:hypothetical protein